MSNSWQNQEKRVARRRGGKRTPGSGSGWRLQNDVREARGKVLWEMKTTGKSQITIKIDDWDKLRSNAIHSDRIAAMHLQLGDGERRMRRLVVISEDDFNDLCPPEL